MRLISSTLIDKCEKIAFFITVNFKEGKFDSNPIPKRWDFFSIPIIISNLNKIGCIHVRLQAGAFVVVAVVVVVWLLCLFVSFWLLLLFLL